MRITTWLVAIVGLGLTVPYVLEGLSGDGPAGWVNGFLAGPILLLFVVPDLFLLRWLTGGGDRSARGDVPKAFRGAPLAIGTVVSTARTGLSVNDQPQLDIVLDVDTTEGRSFRAVLRRVVDLTELSTLRAGLQLPVRYRPGGGDGRVVLASDADPREVQRTLSRVRLAKGQITARQLRVGEEGVDTNAVVLAMAPTGEVRHDAAVVDLTLRVTRVDGTMFDITRRKTIPATAVARLQPGMVVRARYLPHDETEVVVLTPADPSVR
ncbi:hypothetical protein [Streptomyces hainanensis]|uniref:Uncharacterized protein n=1 Tax=Streptomyces hainanensis TaxID=402648 RepID=A0A4R4TNW2_9ACTN|nr:hypothetical protein [Streptomyces hainanensis]TDC79721.1 hypothetical protein E1283_02240 [Streptomyces hainanensis]